MKEIKIKYYFENQVYEKEIINDIFDDIDNMYIWDHIYELNLDWWDFKVLDRCFFTWFLDENWTEIFEWDILENNFFGILWYVVYDSEKWAYQIVNDKLKTSNYLTNFDDLKLIWNIYENKNLIDKF